MRMSFAVVAATIITGLMATGLAQAEERVRPWNDDDLRALAKVAVQDGGRVKPLDTYASFLLLRLNGKRSFRTGDGEKIGALEWLLDSLLFPNEARDYRVFLVENAEVLDAIGVTHEKKRDRYSYDQLQPARPKLFDLARQYSHIDDKDRTPVQTQIVNLAINMSEYERLTGAFEFARATISPSGIAASLWDGDQPHSVSGVLKSAGAISESLNRGDLSNEDRVGVSRLFAAIESAFGTGGGPALIPPPGTVAESEEWMTPGDAAMLAFAPMVDASAQIEALELIERLEETKKDPQAFSEAVDGFSLQLQEMAEARGEYGKIGMEVAYYRAKFFYYSLVGFVFCFLLAAINWIAPRNNALWWAGLISLIFPTAYLIAGITLRCIIRGRPPVTTLYESILFITATVVVLGIAIEWMNRERIALSLTAALGVLGLFLANKYEVMEGVDTMPSLVAVLDTNFWLATHVTTVTIGYAAGLLAAGVAHIFLLGKLIGFKKNDGAFYRSIVKLTYGIICFGLVFSVVGTVLGGIWANYSWGRFWGWDPKENGALMIVLWELAILHLRLGGKLKQWGLCLAAVFGGIIVAFSWFGVNLLGVGLHSYGFTSGIARALMVFYAVESGVLFLGAIAWFRAVGLGSRGAHKKNAGDEAPSMAS